MRKTYGNTWWGRQWLHALNNIDYANRLPRGRTYANKGLVKEIQIENNQINALVQGSRPKPYRVKLTIPSFRPPEETQLIKIITGTPAFLSKLLNRELPTELYQSALDTGINLFPRSWDELRGNCSCPDWAVPCKHIAAVLYLIGNEIDKNPFMVFQLRGFDLFEKLKDTGYTLDAQQDLPILQREDLWQPYQATEKPFEWQAEVFNQLDFSTLPDCQDQVLLLLSENPPFFTTGDCKQMLKKVLVSVSRNLKKSLKADPAEELTGEMDAVEDIELLLDETTDFLTCTFRNNKGNQVKIFDEISVLNRWLQTVPLNRLDQLAPALRGLLLTYHLAEKLAVNSACIPQLLQLKGAYKIRWMPALFNESVKALCEKVKILTPPNLLYYKVDQEFMQPVEKEVFPALLSVFLSNIIQNNNSLGFSEQQYTVPRLFFNGSLEFFDSFENRESPLSIQLWLNRFYLSEKDYVPVLLVAESELGFEVTIAVEQKTRPLETPIPLRRLFTDEALRPIRMEVLRDLSLLADHFPQLNRLVNAQGNESLFFDANEFVEVLFQVLPTIQLFGIKVLLPKALRRLFRPQLSMQLEGQESGTVSKSSVISMEKMLQFKWQVAMGDTAMSPAEFSQMVGRLSGIVKLNDQYVYFDEKEIQSLLKKLENPPEPNEDQLLQVALTEEYEGAKVKLDAEARKLIEDLMAGEPVAVPEELRATLRPYQLRGYEWLYKNARLGFGSLIADDMGLGKTLQVITTLLKLKEEGAFKKQKGLIIVPTTLLTNWEKEIYRFAPSLTTHLYHGPSRSLEGLEKADLLITTYGVVRTESEPLSKMKWLTVIIDEAQNIKNPGTAQTKAVKKIKAPVRIAMSGTPVENRLSEYWSVFDFSNKGYLSSLKKFKEEYARPIEVDRDQHKLERFRRLTAPFILRRLKSDKSIIQDLPDKIEKDQFCQLTPEQAAIYQNVLDNTMKTIEESDGINRRGLVLKLITALKQICNHPRQFLKKGPEDPALSGKAQLLLSLLRQTLENDEKTLIFTQYQEMGKILVNMLENEFGFEAPFLHGGVSRKHRDEMVEDFQNHRTTRVMLLSLKAGGTGLNLTAASNVVHYDLWWNPAVEAQATDRAYRIGQLHNVLVHRFITQGTFEEKINQLLLNKRELADLAVATGEKWVGEMSDAELRELVKLG